MHAYALRLQGWCASYACLASYAWGMNGMHAKLGAPAMRSLP